MKRRFFGAGIVMILLLFFGLTACGSDSKEESGENNNSNNQNNSNNTVELGNEDITLVSDTYVEATASTYLAEQALEEIGYNVEVTDVDLGPMFASIADGSGDASLSAWLPTTDSGYWDEYGDDIEEIGTVIDEAPLGLVVPSYMDNIESIEDIAENKDNIAEELDYTITGVGAGTGQMQITESDVMPEYGLEDWDLIERSDAGMTSALGDAIENKEPIVVTLWYPHWAFQKWDLKLLDDPKNIHGDPDAIKTIAREGLEEDSPAAYQILSQFHIEIEDNEAVMMDLEKDVDPDEAAQNYLDENPELMEEWLEGVK